MRRLGLRVAVLAAFAVLAPALFLQARDPRPAEDKDSLFQGRCPQGEAFRYDLERRVYRDGSLYYRATAVSSHTVLSCAPLDEAVRFEDFVLMAGRQPVDLSLAAASLPSFDISLDSGPDDSGAGDAALPSPETLDQTLRGIVNDLRTVLTAVCPHAVAGRLNRMGDVYVGPAGRKRSETGARWRETCTQVRMELTSLTPTQAGLKVAFLPPESECLAFQKPWMGTPLESAGPPNNYQQVAKAGGLYRASWGQERVVVSAVLDRKTGTVVSAEMEDTRVLKERTRCDGALEHCSPETPVLNQRSFSLRLRETLPGPRESAP